MVLSKHDILDRIRNGELKFDPMLDGFQMQPHSIDLRLGFDFHLPRTWELTQEGRKALNVDPLRPNAERENFEKITLKPGQFFELLPKEFVIAATLEYIELDSEDVMAVLYPRSSINRRGLAVDLSGIIDVGYRGFLMIPIMNNTQEQIIRIYPGERICQIIFQTISTRIDAEQASMHGLQIAKYQDNKTGFIGSKSDKEEEIDLIRRGKVAELKKRFEVKP